MEEKKKRILSSILIGKNKVDRYLNDYKNLINDAQMKFDIDVQNNINSKFEQFQINLYNYARSIVDKSEYFEKSNKIDLLFNEVIVPQNLKQQSIKYSFFDLYRAFRNKNEHYDKINCEDEYIIFKTSISKEKFFQLYDVCNEILNYELNKLEENELINFILSNIEIRASYEKSIIALEKANEKGKKEFSNIYNINRLMIEDFKSVDFENITIEQLDCIYFKLRDYILSDGYKEEFIKRYGLNLYNEVLKMYNDDESSFEEDKKRISTYFNQIYEIERKYNENEKNEP